MKVINRYMVGFGKGEIDYKLKQLRHEENQLYRNIINVAKRAPEFRAWGLINHYTAEIAVLRARMTMYQDMLNMLDGIPKGYNNASGRRGEVPENVRGSESPSIPVDESN